MSSTGHLLLLDSQDTSFADVRVPPITRGRSVLSSPGHDRDLVVNVATMQSIARAQKPVRGRPGCFSAPFPTAMSTHARPAPLLIRRNSAPHYRTWQSPDSAITQAWRDHSPAGGGCGGPCPAPDSDSDIETQQQQHGTRVASNVGPAYNNITAYTGPSASAARKAFPTILEELDQINVSSQVWGSDPWDVSEACALGQCACVTRSPSCYVTFGGCIHVY